MLLGRDGWVQHRESGVLYGLDVTKCMFSSGNVTERARMGQANASGETVVDLFAGIGYYTLPLLLRAGASKVYACEWNPRAAEALERNIAANGIADGRCTVLRGDCRRVAPAGVADRVLLGMLPSSRPAWSTAVRALKAGGGLLHLHENVVDREEQAWIRSTLSDLERAAMTAGRRWRVALEHVEHVKWYAPHVRHVVLDVRCTPRSERATPPDRSHPDRE
mmetsp:Transcript_34693/g.82279  ORF Transcript_34693/g.82279 Transcript_34693/m.82279 type:complete len:221 (+) Transcript_34693:2-664(+)